MKPLNNIELEQIAAAMESATANKDFVFAQMNAGRAIRQLLSERDQARTAGTLFLVEEIKRLEAKRDELQEKLKR